MLAALNTVASSCVTVGIATPIAGYLYNVGNLQGTLAPSVLALGCAWLALVSRPPIFTGERAPHETEAMNGLAIFAFVIMPIIVVAMGYVAVLLREAEARRSKPQPIMSGQPRD